MIFLLFARYIYIYVHICNVTFIRHSILSRASTVAIRASRVRNEHQFESVGLTEKFFHKQLGAIAFGDYTPDNRRPVALA